jgi:hypothetical protein
MPFHLKCCTRSTDKIFTDSHLIRMKILCLPYIKKDSHTYNIYELNISLLRYVYMSYFMYRSWACDTTNNAGLLLCVRGVKHSGGTYNQRSVNVVYPKRYTAGP